MSNKRGGRHSKEDYKRIRQAREAAKQIDAMMAELGDDDYQDDDASAAKEWSLNQRLELVSTAAWSLGESTGMNLYAHEIYDDRVIFRVRLDDTSRLYEASYVIDQDDRVSFASRDQWREVEEGYMPVVRQAPALRSVKATGDYRISGYGVVFGGKDLYGETFTAKTDFGAGRSFVGMPVYYDHGFGSVKSQIGTVVGYEFADDGIVFDIELDRRKKYVNDLMRLAERNALGMSSGAVDHLVYIEKGEIKRWIMGEMSVTPIPAEPRTNAQPKTAPQAAPQAEQAKDAASSAPTIIII